MKLVVGLGNVGDRYKLTRHNAGFMAIDNFVFTRELGVFSHKEKLSAEIVEGKVDDQRCLFVKPSTFMNKSGDSLINIKRYYEVNSSSTLLIHDDVDLDFGTIRVRSGGGSGGHNGIKSLPGPVQKKSLRIRVGVKNQFLIQKDTADFVLDQFSSEEKDRLASIFAETDLLIEKFLAGKLEGQTLRVDGK